MRRSRGRFRALGLLLALAGTGAVGASGTPSGALRWQADPEAQFLLDVRIRQLRLGEGVRAYQTPEGTCVLLGDFVETLDAPIAVDLKARKAEGWAIREDHRIAIDLTANEARIAGRAEPIAAGTVRDTPDGWCVDTAALARWFGIGVKPLTAGSALMLTSEAKLPVEMAMERQQRAAQLRPAKFDLKGLPQVRLPYRMWRAPALDFVVSAGVTYRASDGVRVDRRTSIQAAGEVAHLSYDAQVATNDKGRPVSARARAYRSDPDGGLLGPLRATHFALGDVDGFDTRLSGSTQRGRGLLVTNRPLVAPTAFDRARFEGDLPAGWDAEIYRNDELLAFAKPSGDGRYRFEDVPLLYGENRIRVVLYGPQGQVRSREELVNVGQDNVPPGKTWYWAGASQPGKDLVQLARPPDLEGRPKAQAAVSVEHGLDARTSVGVLARAMLADDERLTFVEGTVRRAVGSALVEVGAAGDSRGGTALRAQALARFGSVHINAEALAANDFHLRGSRPTSSREVRVGVDAPLRLGRTRLPLHGDLRWSDRQDGTSQLEAAARLSANIERFNLTSELKYRRQYLASGPAPPGELQAGVLGTGRIGDVRVRGGLAMDVGPEARLRTAELSAYWSASERTDWEAGVVYDAPVKRARARVSHVRRLDSMAVAITGEAASDGALALGLNLNFSLDSGHRFRLSRQPLAAAGAVHARVYRDLNANGVRDPGEPGEKGALVTTGRKAWERPTGGDGTVLVGGLSGFMPVPVGIDGTSLGDPMLVPKHAVQIVVPRPGVAAEVEIGLVGGGAVEGALVKSGGLGVEGATLELIGPDGKVAATAISDFDGFFLFERVPYGQYRLRLSQSSAEALAVTAELGATVTVSEARSVARLGAIHLPDTRSIAARE